MAIEDFTGTIAVVTGGASGIGRATARALYAQGARVALAACLLINLWPAIGPRKAVAA